MMSMLSRELILREEDVYGKLDSERVVRRVGIPLDGFSSGFRLEHANGLFVMEDLPLQI
jgi:hypothetical protein